MALSDKEIQDLQGFTKSYVRLPEGKVFKIDDTGKYYKIVHCVDNTTQAMAVVPVDGLAGNNPNYKETTIVVAGTQPVFGRACLYIYAPKLVRFFFLCYNRK